MKNLQKIILTWLAVLTLAFVSSVSFASENGVILTKDNVLEVCELKDSTLDCSNKNIISVEKWCFEWLSNLEWFSLNKNKIINIEKWVFDWLTNLQGLDLRQNQIINIEKWALNWLVNLQILDLIQNKITSIKECNLNWLSSLQELYLGGNNITSIKKWDFNLLGKLQQLWIAWNNVENIDYIDFSCMPLEMDGTSHYLCPSTFEKNNKKCIKKWFTEETAKNRVIIECWDFNENTTNEEYTLTSKDNTLVSIIAQRLESKFEENGETYKKSILNVLSLLWNKYRTIKPRISAILLSTIKNIKK